jgi:predicted small lipoprotein YifL
MRMRRLLTMTLLACLLGACGQKGPLYLPDKNGSVVTTPAASPPPAQAPATPKKSPDDADGQSPPQS